MKLDQTPLQSLENGNWFKLICGASFQDLPAIRTLALVYTLAGADCIDVAADPAVITATKEGIKNAEKLAPIAIDHGYFPQTHPFLMMSLNDGEDPHFRKADFNPTQCPSDCHRPCQTVCPAQAIAFTPTHQGIIDQRCYGCGRCLPVCPSQLIFTRSYVSTPSAILPLIENQGIDALEIHTHVGNEANFTHLWSYLAPYIHNLKLLAISCPDHPQLIPYLRTLAEIINPLPCPLVWQTDGRPMSGDIGKGTTHATIKLGEKVLKANLGGYVQLAGGTNHHTIPKLRTLELLKGNKSVSQACISGVAYGSYARSLLSSFWEDQGMAINDIDSLESHPNLLWQAVHLASSLIYPLKFPVDPQ
ncbi:MAG: circadian clock protein LdpA [Microcystaceae cyanobacterium]